MGLISRVSSRTYRDTSPNHVQPRFSPVEPLRRSLRQHAAEAVPADQDAHAVRPDRLQHALAPDQHQDRLESPRRGPADASRTQYGRGRRATFQRKVAKHRGAYAIYLSLN